MKSPWTENRKKVATFLQSYFREHERSPSLDEIAVATGLWKRSVEIVLKGLEKIGFLEITPGISRGIRLSDFEFIRVPLIGNVQAGNPVSADTIGTEILKIDRKLIPFKNPLALRVDGFSMRDAGILPGDIILLTAQKTAKNAETIVAILNGGYTVKTYHKKGSMVSLHPANPAYKIIMVRTEDEFTIVGKVMVIFRDLGDCYHFTIEKSVTPWND